VVNPQAAQAANWGDGGKLSLDYADNANDVTDLIIPSATAITQTTNQVSNQALTVTPATTGVKSTVKLVFQTNIMMPALTSSQVKIKLPTFFLSGSDAPTVEGCGTGLPVFTTAVAASGTANAAITFSLTTDNDIEAATLCTITTHANTVVNPQAAQAANWGSTGKLSLVYAATGNNLAETAIPSATAITQTTNQVSNQALTVTPATTGVKSTVKLVFQTNIMMPALTSSQVKIKLPTFFLSGSDAPTVEGCGTGLPVFTTAVAASGTANAAITFSLTTDNDIEAATLCTITTHANTVVNPQAAQAANWGDGGKLSLVYAATGNNPAETAIPSATAITQTTNQVSNQTLTVTPATTGVKSTIKLVFQTNIMMPALTSSKLTLALPNFNISGNTNAPTVEGCGTGLPVFTTAVAASGTANAAITFSLTTDNDIEAATLCTITTHANTVVNPQTTLAENWGSTGKLSLNYNYTVDANDVTDLAIPNATAITQSINAVSNQALTVTPAIVGHKHPQSNWCSRPTS